VIGRLIDGKYEIVRPIGSGAMGAVYEARHRATGRAVAIKLIVDEKILESEQHVARFEREARAAAALRSPHIVEILDAGRDGVTRSPYMVMELLVGEGVLALLRRLGRLSHDLALRIGAQVCRGLRQAHLAGVVHRDVKPANLFLEKGEDDGHIVKLLDFGVAKVKMDQAAEGGSQSLTRTGSVLGSPLYMSPEQARGRKDIDHRADLWSLGVVLYQLMSGKPPHHGIDGIGDLVLAICSDPPAALRSRAGWVPEEVERIVERALRIAPEERYQSAGEMLGAIEAYFGAGADLAIKSAMLVGIPDAAGERRPLPKARPAAGAPAAPSEGESVATMELGESEIETAAPAGTDSAAVTLDASTVERVERTPPRADPRPDAATVARDDGARAPPVPRARRDLLGTTAGRVVVSLVMGTALGLGGALAYHEARGGPARAWDGAPAGSIGGGGPGSTSLPSPPPTAPSLAASASSPPAAASLPPSAADGAASAPRASSAPEAGSAGAAPASSDGVPAPGMRLTIVPPFAGVLIDGRAVSLAPDGSVEVAGEVGSAHNVVVTVAGVSRSVSVILTAEGVRPPVFVHPGRGGGARRADPYE
jgi:serine/threonine-protein kinase